MCGSKSEEYYIFVLSYNIVPLRYFELFRTDGRETSVAYMIMVKIFLRRRFGSVLFWPRLCLTKSYDQNLQFLHDLTFVTSRL